MKGKTFLQEWVNRVIYFLSGVLLLVSCLYVPPEVAQAPLWLAIPCFLRSLFSLGVTEDK